MSPGQKQLVEQLRAAIAQKKDPAEQAVLLGKLASVERGRSSAWWRWSSYSWLSLRW